MLRCLARFHRPSADGQRGTEYNNDDMIGHARRWTGCGLSALTRGGVPARGSVEAILASGGVSRAPERAREKNRG